MAAILTLLLGACGVFDETERVTISGRVPDAVPAPATSRAAAPSVGARTISHVMAVNPETASPQRTIAAIGSDGSFTLEVDATHPYVLVFVDSSAVGADMVVAVFRTGELDALPPQLAGHLELGDVAIDPATQTATSGIGYDELIAALGLSASAAEYLGSIDDLSLRYANPDIDGDGVIDLQQDRSYALDFHVRSSMRRGSATGAMFTVADITDKFLPDSGTDIAMPVYDLTSIYVLYPASYDPTDYIPTGVPSTEPQHGGHYTATLADGSAPSANTSFSGLGFGDTRGWGPDYDFTRDATLELPGSTGSPATLAFTLGAIGKTLTFTNVVTRPRASLTGDGTLVIFARLVTTAGVVTSIDYRWMKRASASAWIEATSEEIGLAIGSTGGYLSIHRAAWSDESGVAIPAQPSGSVPWEHATTSPDAICGLAISYDDKLGLRHFAGGVAPNPTATCHP